MYRIATKISKKTLFVVCMYMSFQLSGQEVAFKNFTVDKNGQAEIEIEADADLYYVLYTKHSSMSPEFAVSITSGIDGDLKLKESLGAYPEEQYRVQAFQKSSPGDIDGDGIDDLAEMDRAGEFSPLNPAQRISIGDGSVCIHSQEDFSILSYKGQDVLIDTHLSDLEFVKFYILDADTNNPYLYFMNTVKYRSHGMFARGVGLSNSGGGRGGIPGSMRGEIVYHPKVEAPNGKLGVYRFEFEPNDSYSFGDVQRMYEFLASNMPYLENNWSYYPMPNAALPLYYREQSQYNDSRIEILLEEDIFDQVDYLALNITEGYGQLRVMELDERPNSRDVVLYESLPNEMPRVGGIITTVTQTPLSHVNLRAIQDNVPNAFIRNAADLDEIEELVGKFVYYKVERNQYILREASLSEVEAFYEDKRPKEDQVLERDLSVTGIMPLDEIGFEMSTAFGVKTANMATMGSFGFPAGTIREGFGIPFYFYDEYMKFNGFYEEAQKMLDNQEFQTDFDVQEDMLKDFRKTVENGEMPPWMLDELDEMHKTFPLEWSIRTRSSTNNEDLPGFSGAGLYDSKTQRPDEGHIEKSIKEVYASMWNFRAFDEREFYRINHFDAAMGILVHRNFSDELANGVAVSTDPINFTDGTYLINTQVGEDLVTNPEALSIPEEILLDENAGIERLINLVRGSNQAEVGTLIMTDDQYLQLRDHLKVIHDQFKVLYGAEDQEDFAMEIEYKITQDTVLAIKQARPWAEFWLNQASTTTIKENVAPSQLALQNSPNPFDTETWIEFSLPTSGNVFIRIYNESGQIIGEHEKDNLVAGNYAILLDEIVTVDAKGLYFYELIIRQQDKIVSATNKMVKID